MEAAPRIVVFDIGNVLVHWDPRAFYDRTIGPEARARLFAEVALDAMNEAVDLGHDLEAVVKEKAARHPAWAEPIRDWHRRWLDLIGPETEAAPLVEAVREAGLAVWALTNFGDATFVLAQSHFEVMRRFDGAIVSGRLGIAKPDPAIYAAREAATGTSGDEIFFTDDRAENIDAAAVRFWRTHHFEGAEGLRAALAAAGVRLARPEG